MKVALAFWGITRSLSQTIDSIRTNIFTVLRKNGIEYTVFLHTYVVPAPFSNIRTKEQNCKLNPLEYTLLDAEYIALDDQDYVRKQLDLIKYRTHKDPWKTGYNSVDNYICAMYSKQRVTKLVTESKIPFDRIVFLRPDVRYLTPFRVEWLQSVDNESILVPDFHLYTFKINDRFSVTNYENGVRIGNIFDSMYDYSLKNPLHSETLLYTYVTETLHLRIVYIPFYFNRVRANGSELRDAGTPKLLSPMRASPMRPPPIRHSPIRHSPLRQSSARQLPAHKSPFIPKQISPNDINVVDIRTITFNV